MRVLVFGVILFGLLFPGFCQAQDWATLMGEFVSIVPLPDKAVLVLSRKNELIKVPATGAPENLPLPPFPAEVSGGTLQDFTIQGSTLTFCFFDRLPLLSIDFPKLDAWKIIHPVGVGEKPEFAQIEAGPGSLRIMGASGKWFSLDASGKAAELPEFSLLIPDSQGRAFTLQSGNDPQDGLKTWKILGADGTEFLVRKSADRDNRIQTFRPIGFDANGSLLFFESTGPGPFKSSSTLYAAKDGKVIASCPLGSATLSRLIKGMAILSDGSVAFLEEQKEGGSLALKRFSLK